MRSTDVGPTCSVINKESLLSLVACQLATVKNSANQTLVLGSSWRSQEIWTDPSGRIIRESNYSFAIRSVPLRIIATSAWRDEGGYRL